MTSWFCSGDSKRIAKFIINRHTSVMTCPALCGSMLCACLVGGFWRTCFEDLRRRAPFFHAFLQSPVSLVIFKSLRRGENGSVPKEGVNMSTKTTVQCRKCGKTGTVGWEVNLATAVCPKCKSKGSFQPVVIVEKVVTNTDKEMTTCPMCNEEIRIGAKKCKHCGEMIGEKKETPPAPQPSQAAKPVKDPIQTPPPEAPQPEQKDGPFGTAVKWGCGIVFGIALANVLLCMLFYGGCAGCVALASKNDLGSTFKSTEKIHTYDEYVTIGDAQVKIASCISGKVWINGFGSKDEQSNQLKIKICIINPSKSKTVKYSGWGTSWSSDKLATLTDDSGKTYKLWSGSLFSSIDGQITSIVLYPNEYVNDIFVFEKPYGQLKYLDLELPADNVGSTGSSVKIRIPADKIIRID